VIRKFGLINAVLGSKIGIFRAERKSGARVTMQIKLEKPSL